MDELFARQALVLRRLIHDYREGLLGLDPFIQRLEGISEVLNDDVWKDAVFPIVLSMEQVNASALDEGRGLSEADMASIDSSLNELEALLGASK